MLQNPAGYLKHRRQNYINVNFTSGNICRDTAIVRLTIAVSRQRQHETGRQFSRQLWSEGYFKLTRQFEKTWWASWAIFIALSSSSSSTFITGAERRLRWLETSPPPTLTCDVDDVDVLFVAFTSEKFRRGLNLSLICKWYENGILNNNTVNSKEET